MSLEAAFVLDKLVTPSLRTLRFEHGRAAVDDAQRIWLSSTTFLERSQPPLEELRISRLTGVEQLISLLSCIPTLTSLSLSAGSVYPPFYSVFTLIDGLHESPSGFAQILCPCLTSLTIRSMDNQPYGGMLPIVGEMILSRCLRRDNAVSSFKPLTRLHLENAAIDKKDLLKYPGIDACVVAGLNLIVW